MNLPRPQADAAQGDPRRAIERMARPTVRPSERCWSWPTSRRASRSRPSRELTLSVEDRRPPPCHGLSCAGGFRPCPGAATRSVTTSRSRSAIAQEGRNELRQPADPHAAHQIHQRRRSFGRHLAGNAPRAVGCDAAADFGVRPCEVDDIERFDEESRPIGQDPRADAPIARTVAGRDPPRASRMKPTSMFCVASNTLETRGNWSRLRFWIATCASSFARSAAFGRGVAHDCRSSPRRRFSPADD